MAIAQEQLVIEASVKDAMTAEIQQLTAAVKSFADAAKLQFDSLNKVVTQTPKEVEKIAPAVKKTEESVDKAAPKVKRLGEEVQKSGTLADIAARRYLAFGKAAIGIFATDVIAKVLGFKGAMDLVRQAADYTAEAIQTAFGRNSAAAKSIEEMTERVTALKDAMLAQYTRLSFRGEEYRVNRSRLQTPEGQLAAEQLALDAQKKLNRIAEMDRLALDNADKPLYEDAAKRALAERTDVIRKLTDGLLALESAEKRAADERKKGAEAQKKEDEEWLDRLKRGAALAKEFRNSAQAQERIGSTSRFALPFALAGVQAGQGYAAFKNARDTGGAPSGVFGPLAGGINAAGGFFSNLLTNGSGVPNAYQARTSGGGTGLLGTLLPTITQGLKGFGAAMVDTIAKAATLEFKLDAAFTSIKKSLDSSLASEIVYGSFNSLTSFFNNVITGATKGSEAIRQFGQSILSMGANILAQRLAIQTLGLFGLGAPVVSQANGGVWRGGIQSFANGGVAYGPQMAMIGDNRSQTEAIVPMPDGRSIPVRMQGGGGSTNNIAINISAIDGASVAAIMPQIEARLIAALSGGNQQFRMSVRGA